MSLSPYQTYYAVSAFNSDHELIGVRICENPSQVRTVLAEMLAEFPLCEINVANAHFTKDTTIAYASYSEGNPGDFRTVILRD